MEQFSKKRIEFEKIEPQVDCGRFPAKRIINDKVKITANVFSDGHYEISVELLYRQPRSKKFVKIPMTFIENDIYEAEFIPKKLGSYHFKLSGWIDEFASWVKVLIKKKEAEEDLDSEIGEGIKLVERAIKISKNDDAKRMEELLKKLNGKISQTDAYNILAGEELKSLMKEYPVKMGETSTEKEFEILVERKKAEFSTWYELFPRSCGKDGKHGTFKDCEKKLLEIASMGFDVLYLPPIHQIGEKYRKGKNNSLEAKPNDPGSPWQIGLKESGHKSVHHQLGTIKDFEHLVSEAAKYGLEVAIDFAIQCSQDHPYIKEHPEWFKWRQDGTVQYAENPPKKYQDIVPVNFDIADNRPLWEEMKSIVHFWVEKGVRIIRVDNPHTKPFPFWEWLIKEIKKDYPEVIFLAEAFTKPNVMYMLAKAGFTQSYTYFTWRYTKKEYTKYLNELTKTEVKEFFRPNFWPNTPDILMEYLQKGGKPVFINRYILAATMSSNCGIYGPAYELCVTEHLPGKEEYLDSEKYEIKKWDWDKPGNIRNIISTVNRIRKENPALQKTNNIEFCEIDNDLIIAYLKISEDKKNIILVVVNMDPKFKQSGWVQLPFKALGLNENFYVHDLLDGKKYEWQINRNYIELDPNKLPAHIFRIEKK